MDTGTIEINALSPKELHWRQTVEHVEKVEKSDPHGLKIDAHVKNAVIGLNVFGFRTTMSCEGHLENGFENPYIKIANAEAMQKEHAATDAYLVQRHVDYERLREESEKLNSALHARLTTYLDEFYGSREVKQEVRLVAEINNGRILLKNHGSKSQGEVSIAESSNRLSAYQGEMEEFGSFLEKKFFSES